MVRPTRREPQSEQQGKKDLTGGAEKRRKPVLDRSHFCDIGLSDKGIDPRRAHTYDQIVTKQDLMNEFQWVGRGPINLRQALTIERSFLKALRDKVYPYRGNWATVGMCFARGAIASHRGSQVDWATFAYESQFRGKYALKRARLEPLSTAASPPSQREVVRTALDLLKEAPCQENRACEISEEEELGPQEGVLVCVGQEEELADEPRSDRDSELSNGIRCSRERRNRVYNELRNWIKYLRMIEHESMERQARGSGPSETSKAAQNLESGHLELGPIGPSPQVDFNDQPYMDVSGGQESACLPLPQSWTGPWFEDIRSLPSGLGREHPQPRPQTECLVACRDVHVEAMVKGSGPPGVKSQTIQVMETRDHEPGSGSGPSRPVYLNEEMQVDVSGSKVSDCSALAQFRDPTVANMGTLANRTSVSPPEPRPKQSQQGTQAVHVQSPECRHEPACKAALNSRVEFIPFHIGTLSSRSSAWPPEPRQEQSEPGTQAVNVQPRESRHEAACKDASNSTVNAGMKGDLRLLELSSTMFKMASSCHHDCEVHENV